MGEHRATTSERGGRDHRLTAAQVRAVAKLSRLTLDEEQVERLRGELSAVLAYMDRLAEVDVSGVEPMTHPTEAANRLDEDRPAGSGVGGTIRTEAFMAIAPETLPPFVKVPPVLGEGSS